MHVAALVFSHIYLSRESLVNGALGRFRHCTVQGLPRTQARLPVVRGRTMSSF